MDTGILRDLVIIITGLLNIVFFILVGLVAFLSYRQIKSLISLTKDAARLSRETGAEVKDTLKSTKTLAGMFMGRSAKEDCEPPANPLA